ncbi:DUF2403 domain-containing lipoprotein [Pendulispora albinea]|uniref:DUF2403 domain-containing lipoprotein n=1 Tax=Pendulispora albinea TaxID=2741071 RepID=A0ABZ2LVG1_9BACT
MNTFSLHVRWLRVAALAVGLGGGAIVACGTSSGDLPGGSTGQSDASAPPQGPGPAGDPNTGVWTDLGNTHAPDHTSAIATNEGVVTRGGTMTFTNIGAPGYWGRVIEAEPGDPRCDVQSETIHYDWGNAFCCRTKHVVTSNTLTPFNEQITMVLDGPLRVKQMAVYQPLAGNGGPWAIRSFWDRRAPDRPYNLHFSGPKKSTTFSGDLGNSCTFFAMQEKPFRCGHGSDPYCPGSDLDFDGWPGSKLVVLLASMPYADDPTMKPSSCIGAGQNERQQDSPWVGIAPSELSRDGWSGYNPCHCFANTNAAVGDGCGQINVFEVIAEASGSKWGNRDIISTGVRSYQVGSLGGATCGIDGCQIGKFPTDADLLDANSLTAMPAGAVIDADHRATAAGPVWRRARDDRYYLFLLDEASRTVQVAVIHPQSVPEAARTIVPALPNTLSRSAIEGFVHLRLPR